MPLKETFVPHCRVFKRMDENGDKRLQFHEFKEGLDVLGSPVDEGNLRVCFDEMDPSGDGCVNFDEFLIALRVIRYAFLSPGQLYDIFADSFINESYCYSELRFADGRVMYYSTFIDSRNVAFI